MSHKHEWVTKTFGNGAILTACTECGKARGNKVNERRPEKRGQFKPLGRMASK